MRRFAKRAGLFVVSFGFFLTVAELLLRFYLVPGYYVWPPGFRQKLDPDPNIIHGVTAPARLTINSLGMRGDPLEDGRSYHLLAVGGSTTICIYLDDAKAWPYLLQERLNLALGPRTAWVGNVGRPGHTTAQHALQVEKLLHQHPEIDALLLLIGINDLLIPIAWTLDPQPPVFGNDPRAKWRNAFAMFPGWDADSPWYSRNALGRLWRLQAWRPVRSITNLPVLDEKGEFFRILRDHRKQASVLRQILPDLSLALSAFVRNANEIVDVAEAAAVRVIFLTQPTLWKAEMSQAESDLLWAGGPSFDRLRRGAEYYSVEALASGMAAFDDALRRVCRERGVECLDAANELPKSTTVFYDDAHFTDRGSAMLAELLADYLLERKPLAALRP